MPAGRQYVLLNLHVKNFAVIDESEVDFEDNLNVITGETGAGKSIIIGSVYVALGGRVTKEMIRSGAEYALVEMSFTNDSETVRKMLEEAEIPSDEDTILISRRIYTNGRSVLRVNGENVTAALWKNISSMLIDIHGQQDNRELNREPFHLEVLDKFIKDEIKDLKQELRESFSEYKRLERELSEANTDEAERNRNLSLMRYEADEIAAARLRPGEDDELESDYRRLSHAKTIAEQLGGARTLISDGEQNAISQIGYAVRYVSKACEYDNSLNGILESLSSAEDILSDAAREIASKTDGEDLSEEAFTEVSRRLDTLNLLKSKYGRTIEDILAYGADLSEKIDKAEHFDEYIGELKTSFENAKKKTEALSEKLSKIRQEHAAKLTEKIKQALTELNFLQVRLEMQFGRKPALTENGFDDASFMISLNPGQEMRPLSKVASGGEMSRIMLAVKSVLADSDEIHTLIFDEIDAGISGRTAQAVALKMAGIAKNHQIISITHLPQIAAMADNHYVIEKKTDNVNTYTSIRLLNEKDSGEELARLLGGAKITESVMNNAREMKELASKEKEEERRK